MIGELLTHVIVSSTILVAAILAATWIRPLTARTRHAVLLAGMASLALPAPLLARFFEKNDVAIMGIGGAAGFLPPALVNGGLQPAAPRLPWIVIIWLVVAAMLLLRWWLVTRRLVTTAMRSATPPPPRSVKALDAARARLNLHQSVDLIASPTCEAPAVVRVLRPMIILPANGCESLDDEELESLLCHECAHVARRDNLLGVFEAIVCSLFWFNPLVWLAHRRIAATREAACDERVADVALPAETYVGALAKICRSLLVPRVPAVSCMASAHLKERIEHIMSYDTLRKSAFSHRFTAATSVLALLLVVAAAAIVTAEPVVKKDEGRYRLNYSLQKVPEGQLLVRTRIIDTTTGKVIGEPSVTTTEGKKATTILNRDDDGQPRQWVIDVEPLAGGGEVIMTVHDGDAIVQTTRSTFRTPAAETVKSYSGAPITLNLANADIRDVLGTFAKLTGTTIETAPEVQGVVTVNAVDTPWDQALDEIIRDAGYAYRIDGGKIIVYKP